MKTFPELLNLARLGSENVDYTDTTGIQDSEVYQYMTDAVRRLESVIFSKHPKAFTKHKTIDVASSASYISLPGDCYMQNRLITLEWSKAGQNDFYLLKKGNAQERFAGINGDPIYYIPFGQRILLRPGNSQPGQLRMLYQLAQPAADKKRGIISSLTVNTTTRTISAITLDVSSTDAPLDDATINENQFLCVVDRYGRVKVKDLEISEVDGGTGVLSLYGGSFVYDTDESISVGDYVCAGGYSSFKSILTDNCERFILQYAIWKMQKRDSSSDNAEALLELKQLEDDIVASYSEVDSDVDYVPILDTQYIGTDYDDGFY